ncbi:Heat shock cognate 70 kDa protein, partial [Mucuna pruriens]
MSAEEILRLIQEAEKYQAEDRKFFRMATAKNSLDLCVYKMRNALKKDISSQERENINSVITKTTNLLETDNHQDKAEVFEDHLKDLVTLFQHVIGKIGYLERYGCQGQARIDQARPHSKWDMYSGNGPLCLGSHSLDPTLDGVGLIKVDQKSGQKTL